MRFLIDECLTPLLVSVATQSGYEAYHIARIGKAGWPDPDVTRHAIREDFILVTNNAGDYRNLYRREPLHAGLIIIVPNVNRTEQMRLFHGVLARLTAQGEPINHVLEIDTDGSGVIFSYHEHYRES